MAFIGVREGGRQKMRLPLYSLQNKYLVLHLFTIPPLPQQASVVDKLRGLLIEFPFRVSPPVKQSSIREMHSSRGRTTTSISCPSVYASGHDLV